MTDIVTLRSGALRLDLAPAIGGAISRFASETPDGEVEWMRPMSAAALAAGEILGASCFPLVPFSNRIRDNGFAFDGQRVRMTHSFPHALHGHGWLAPWQVDSVASDRASLVFTRDATADWPFAYRARQDFVLADGCLVARIDLVNSGDRRMPAGFGLHPYFPRTPRCRLHAAVTGLWETDAAILPTRLVAPDAPRDPRAGLAVDAVPLDNCFTGWDGRAEIVWPETGTALTMTAEGPLGFFVVYTPTGEPYFCAEPVSNATDAVNLAATGRDDTGLLILEPGQTASARIVFAPRGPA
jgi:aldose 1-epimerase